jgi:hypothetical protein
MSSVKWIVLLLVGCGGSHPTATQIKADTDKFCAEYQKLEHLTEGYSVRTIKDAGAE